MEASTTPDWKPDGDVVRWAWSGLISMLIGGSIGTIGFWMSNYGIAAVGIVLGLLVFLVSIIAFWRAVGRAQGIPEPCKHQLRGNALLLGPVAVLQLLIYNYFPNCGFSGLRCGTDEQKA